MLVDKREYNTIARFINADNVHNIFPFFSGLRSYDNWRIDFLVIFIRINATINNDSMFIT